MDNWIESLSDMMIDKEKWSLVTVMRGPDLFDSEQLKSIFTARIRALVLSKENRVEFRRVANIRANSYLLYRDLEYLQKEVVAGGIDCVHYLGHILDALHALNKNTNGQFVKSGECSFLILLAGACQELARSAARMAQRSLPSLTDQFANSEFVLYGG